MQRRAPLAVALALGVAGAPSRGEAQPNRNLPGADTPRLLVVVFQSADRIAGVQVADAIRTRLLSTSNPRQLYIIPKEQMVSFLESSGYKADSSLGATDLKELARGLRADEVIGGAIIKNGTGNYSVEPRLMLASDPTIAQPLPAIQTGNFSEAGRHVERAAGEARRQLRDHRDCQNHIRAGAMDKAVLAATAGITKYGNATIARLCLANAYQVARKPDSVITVTEEILRLDPKNSFARRMEFTAYKDKADQEPDSTKRDQYREASVRALVALLALEPGNVGLQGSVVTELAKLGRPSAAIPIVDMLLQSNPGDPALLRQRWLLMLAAAQAADSAARPAAFGRAVDAGEEMVKADTALADSVYYVKQIFAAMASAPQRGAEFAARALQRFPTNQEWWWLRARAEQRAGQLQAAQQSVSRLLALNPKYPLANIMLGQLFLDQSLSDSAVALARRAVAAGEDPKTWGTVLLRPTQDAVKKAQDSDAEAKKDTLSKEKAAQALADWEVALSLAQETDKLSPSATSKFFVGVSSFQVGYDAINKAQKGKSCPLARRAQDMFLLTQVSMPAGGSINPSVAQQVLGFVAQAAPAADQMVKQYCK